VGAWEDAMSEAAGKARTSKSAGFPALFGGSPHEGSGKLLRERRPSGSAPET